MRAALIGSPRPWLRAEDPAGLDCSPQMVMELPEQPFQQCAVYVFAPRAHNVTGTNFIVQEGDDSHRKPTVSSSWRNCRLE